MRNNQHKFMWLRRREFLTGFTIFEIIIVIAIVVILAASITALVNPPRLYSKARNTERSAHVNTILNAIGENITDNRGSFNCSSGALPTSTLRMATSTGTSTYHIAPCLVPAYLPAMPYDPNLAGAHYSSTTDYDTGYTILRNASSGRITVAAPGAELNETISVTR